jgi:GT2 family glycosyltransferase
VRPLLCIMNARAIPECIDSYRALDVDLAWMTGFTDAQLGAIHRSIVAATDYTHYLVVSDDCIVTQAALDAVLVQLAADRPAATGWCKLHAASPLANLCHAPLIGDLPMPSAYPFYEVRDVREHPDAEVPTHFMGFALTGMTRELWERFPYGAYTAIRKTGYSSDFHLCVRLRDAGVPMVAARDGYVEHLKVVGKKPRSHRLLIGRITPEVRIERRAAA